jgi:SAM-dependent MidA family methyltransferase
MEEALYDPANGYYAGRRKIGRQGDFYTSVSVGPCFGGLLADHCHTLWARMGSPRGYHIVEQGANDGQLAHDFLTAARTVHPEFFQNLEYTILEPLENLAAWQQEELACFADKVRWTPSLPQYPTGIYLCNELLDAFPVAVVRHTGGRWEELGVSAAPPYSWATMEGFSDGIEQEIHRIFGGSNFPDGYTTEICLGIAPWMQSVAQIFETGHSLIFDYGLERADYYHPERITGTLRGYLAHQMLTNLPADIQYGLTDLTAHVEWTRVEECAAACGLEVDFLQTQSRFLTPLATPRLLAMEGRPRTEMESAWLRQFQTLTHPAHLGTKFQALQLRKTRF